MKRLLKKDEYKYVASAKTVEFINVYPKLDEILLITNVTDHIIIYSFADAVLTGTLENNILTLAYDTLTMDNSDILQIYIEQRDEKDSDYQKQLLEDIITELQVISHILLFGFNGQLEDITRTTIEEIKNTITINKGEK